MVFVSAEKHAAPPHTARSVSRREPTKEDGRAAPQRGPQEEDQV